MVHTSIEVGEFHDDVVYALILISIVGNSSIVF